MRLNKKQRIALQALRRIANKYLNDEIVGITDEEYNAISKELGIYLESACRKKKEIKRFIRGKNDIYIRRYHARSSHSDIPKHLHFPFQVKELKEK